MFEVHKPVVFAYLPASHGEHSVAFDDAAYWPAKHGTQMLSTVVSSRSDATEDSPGLHLRFSVHFGWPEEFVKYPPRHRTQVAIPAIG